MTATEHTLRNTTLSIRDGIAEFTHQRPEIRNALTPELKHDYVDMLDIVEDDRSVRALILTGSGGSFCAGGDLKSLLAMRDDPSLAAHQPEAMRRRVKRGQGWLRRLRDLEVPVVAAVDGPAAGAGFSIALTADFVLASERASFSMVFVKIGLVPDMGAMYSLPRTVGLSMAKELMLTGRRVGAAEAHKLGIVHAIHSADALAEDARRFAARFVDGPREAMALTKNALNGTFEAPYDTMLAAEAQGQAVAAAAPYYGEAVQAFLRGEPAKFDWDRRR
ncbi:enoyl-CoA hydratase/isomerase family protein [Cupriavidus pinatubonensis]|uniref:enoyl-CoA hydratase/isomerase family protein n=1 Tax=Cupriavidus pinatubonensis TaxID=248026 RepID=UPI00112E41DC|nr:enoyl-CoA hydratase/isomerase family protein [Cupriavidus pinatubonensis]TPQ43816.1 enoyl-CoA hydratase/isomerase family protein [Cupriavidus pinatubonensis]